MNLDLGPEYEAFRAALEAFLAEHWPAGTQREHARDCDFRRQAAEAGFLYLGFPRAYGGAGTGADPLKDAIVRKAFAAAGAPGQPLGVGVKLLAPTLLARGSDWQKERFIARSLSGEIIWCQGYSEPGSGSDLASLRTKAVLEDGDWVINGSKIWTSFAEHADYMFVLARTEPDEPRHAGISYLLVDMGADGLDVRPLSQMTGESDFNEVFFDDVRTPADWIVGKRGEGWSVANTTLGFERAGINAPSMMYELLDMVKALARSRRRNGKPLIEDPQVMEAIGVVEGHALAHQFSLIRQVSMDGAGQNPGLAALCNKLVGTELGLMIGALGQEIMGDDGLLAPAEGVDRYNMDPMFWLMRSMAVTIAGGTSNIQRNIIAERGLGLPRDRRA